MVNKPSNQLSTPINEKYEKVITQKLFPVVENGEYITLKQDINEIEQQLQNLQAKYDSAASDTTREIYKKEIDALQTKKEELSIQIKGFEQTKKEQQKFESPNHLNEYLRTQQESLHKLLESKQVHTEWLQNYIQENLQISSNLDEKIESLSKKIVNITQDIEKETDEAIKKDLLIAQAGLQNDLEELMSQKVKASSEQEEYLTQNKDQVFAAWKKYCEENNLPDGSERNLDEENELLQALKDIADQREKDLQERNELTNKLIRSPEYKQLQQSLNTLYDTSEEQLKGKAKDIMTKMNENKAISKWSDTEKDIVMQQLLIDRQEKKEVNAEGKLVENDRGYNSENSYKKLSQKALARQTRHIEHNEKKENFASIHKDGIKLFDTLQNFNYPEDEFHSKGSMAENLIFMQNISALLTAYKDKDIPIADLIIPHYKEFLKTVNTEIDAINKPGCERSASIPGLVQAFWSKIVDDIERESKSLGYNVFNVPKMHNLSSILLTPQDITNRVDNTTIPMDNYITGLNEQLYEKALPEYVQSLYDYSNKLNKIQTLTAIEKNDYRYSLSLANPDDGGRLIAFRGYPYDPRTLYAFDTLKGLETAEKSLEKSQEELEIKIKSITASIEGVKDVNEKSVKDVNEKSVEDGNEKSVETKLKDAQIALSTHQNLKPSAWLFGLNKAAVEKWEKVENELKKTIERLEKQLKKEQLKKELESSKESLENTITHQSKVMKEGYENVDKEIKAYLQLATNVDIYEQRSVSSGLDHEAIRKELQDIYEQDKEQSVASYSETLNAMETILTEHFATRKQALQVELKKETEYQNKIVSSIQKVKNAESGFVHKLVKYRTK